MGHVRVKTRGTQEKEGGLDKTERTLRINTEQKDKGQSMVIIGGDPLGLIPLKTREGSRGAFSFDFSTGHEQKF